MLETIREYIDAHEQEMHALLERIVRINSYTTIKSGVDAVGDVLEEVMLDMGFTVRRDNQTAAGDNLIAENALRTDGRRVLLCGHMDTVFPPEDGFDCYRPDGANIIGPGVVDMKGGLVVGIYALKALQAAGKLDDMPIAFVFNSDEEIGSPDSRELIVEQAKNAALALVFECSGPGGKVVTARKGKLSFELAIKGQAGHSGNFTGPKATAILELAHKTIAIEALNNPDKGVSANVGVISGGVGPNTIAPAAHARIECRYWKETDGVILREAIEAVAAETFVPGTTTELTVIPGRPTMEKSEATEKLYSIVKAAGSDLGIPVEKSARGGVSDANFIAQAGTPVLDGMGPTGGKDHSHDEYMIASSLTERTILAAVTMRRAFEELD